MSVNIVLVVNTALFSQTVPTACLPIQGMCWVDCQITCLTGSSHLWSSLSVIIILITSILLSLGKILPLTALGPKILKRTLKKSVRDLTDNAK